MALGNETTRLIVQVGDGADPEVFGFTCGAKVFDITLTNNLGEDSALDCDNPLDVPAAIVRYLQTQDFSVTISGMVATEAWPTWRDWWGDGVEKNIRVLLDETLANNGGYYEGPAYLQTLNLTKSDSGKAQFTAQIAGAGQFVWTDAVA